MGLQMKRTSHELGMRGLGRARGRRGDLLQRRGKIPEAREEYLEARREFLAALEQDPDLSVRLDDAMVSVKLGDLARESPHGSPSERAAALEFALRLYDAAIVQRESVLVEVTGGEREREVKLQLAVALSKSAMALRLLGQLEESELRLTRGLEYLCALESSSPNLPEWKRNRIMAERELAALILDRGHMARAEQIQQRLLEETRALEDGDPDSAEWSEMAAGVLYELGNTLEKSGRLADALDSMSSSLRRYDELLRLDPANANWQKNRLVIARRVNEVAGGRA
jgi:tetratricopeptide (TPR) repeat protein